MSNYDPEAAMIEKYEMDQLDEFGRNTANLTTDQQGLKRDLRLRHMVMIAISGTIGTGLFLTSGSTIALAGPGGACAFNAWGGRIFDEALSFQMNWMYFINWAFAIPAELSASAVIISFWLPENSTFPPWVVPLIIIIIMVGINLVGVKAYGELEYWFSILKVVTILMFIICGILVDAGVLGGIKYGMSAWHMVGAPFKGGFAGFVRSLVMVGYSYGGTEMVAVTAAESRNPHKHVPRAVNTVLIRIAIFYIFSIFLLGSIIPNDDPSLVNENGSVTKAPFTIVFTKAGINVAANFMNAVVFSSVFSAINSDFYIATRVLLSLSRNGWAHESIGYINSRGVPLVALAIVTACACLSLITIFVGSGVVFAWFVSLLGTITFQSWMFILLLHLRFRYCWKKQDRHAIDLPYVSWGYPYGNYLGIVIGFCCIIATFYVSFANAPVYPGIDASSDEMETYRTLRNKYAQGLMGAWFPWIMSAILFFSYKFIRKTKLIRPEDADLDTGRFVPSESDMEDLRSHGPLWKKIVKYIV
ncbi:hypothetical protein BGZ80_007857 [Entomortierella chlamydospora]|uniref:Amino acid permease/ SLC12A domain-containing protein n=1 Tax=Entomortierella chlamydospora TaxID=101097 RepID=A0A9P6T1J4_9FUNG|nr:hypothetical protein BGZ80_007857 [Entomortierella chlamydospora]